MFISHKHRLKSCIQRFNHIWNQPTGYDTGIKVYNCVAKGSVPLIVQNKDAVTWYTCGPTVYDSAHMGHASCYMKLDIIQRILREHFKLNVISVMNITDIDDKIIKRSLETKIPYDVLARDYEKEFWSDLNDLGISKPDRIVRVTERIPEILGFIDGLFDKGLAYVGKDGSIYFDVERYGDSYGKLQNVGESQDDEDPGVKKSVADFALWKCSKPGEPHWKSKYEPGRPGWHIECSAIAGTVLGSKIDIHAGGIDLRFPHHENEEAQSCGYFGCDQWINYWLHVGHLHVRDSVKMSKSLKNTISIQDLLKVCPAEVFRMACIMTNYRNNMSFSEELVQTAEGNLRTIKNFITECNLHIKGELRANLNSDLLLQILCETVNGVHDAYCDGFDTASSLKHIISLIGKTNKMLHSAAAMDTCCDLGVSNLVAISNYVSRNFSNLGINLNTDGGVSRDYDELDIVMDILVKFRNDIRRIGISDKNRELLNLCDNVRHEVSNTGFKLNDRGRISTWSKS